MMKAERVSKVVKSLAERGVEDKKGRALLQTAYSAVPSDCEREMYINQNRDTNFCPAISIVGVRV